MSQIAKSGGHCIIRAKSNINPVIVNAMNAEGRRVKKRESQRLKSVKLKQDDILDLDVSSQKHDVSWSLHHNSTSSGGAASDHVSAQWRRGLYGD